MLSRSFIPPSSKKDLLAYSPMMHARLFAATPKFRANHFLPVRTPLETQEPSSDSAYLDGNPAIDRPLFVQFCANDPKELLEAAKYVAPYCDAVDLNLGCPQGIARKGNYGAFLQEDQGCIERMIGLLHRELDVPVTAKIRILESREKTLEYAKRVVGAGASIITVHGRTRDMKGHKTGLADWGVLKWLREQLGREVVMFANGNVLQHGDLKDCLRETGVDGVMSAEGNLYDPAIFAEPPPVGEEGREYWRGKDGQGGWRADAVFRRYMDILYTHVLETPPPKRQPLYLPSDPEPPAMNRSSENVNGKRELESEDGPAAKKQKKEKREKTSNPNLIAMQAHLFHLLRTLVARHHNVRDALARSRAGDIAAFENVLQLTEAVTKEGLKEYEATDGKSWEEEMRRDERLKEKEGEEESSTEAVRRCKRPWWVVQAYVRPLPVEALKKGSWALSKKDKARLEAEEVERRKTEKEGLDGKVGSEVVGDGSKETVEVPKEGMVCG